MKAKILALAAFAAFSLGAVAQQATNNSEKSMFQTLTKIEKKTDKFNLYFNMHGNFQADWTGSNFDGGKFQMKQFRIEAKGNINSWLSYRYRQRLTKTQEPGSMDNIAMAIDIAGIGVNKGKFGMFLGKQCAAYGGIEFDLNPIEIYQYSDMVDYMSNFLTGANFALNFSPNQQLQFQILDGTNESSYAKYGHFYTPAKLPFVYTLNWNGNFSDVYKTRWSASVMNEVKGKQMWYFALGNEFKISDKVGAYFDWMYSLEGVDRKGIVTEIVGQEGLFDENHQPMKDENGNDLIGFGQKAFYNSFVLHLNYRFAPKWNIFGKAMIESAGLSKGFTGWKKNGNDEWVSKTFDKGTLRNSYGYIAGIEFYPMADSNLHFFATYVGRYYKYTAKAQGYNLGYHNTNRISVGFIWQMPVF